MKRLSFFLFLFFLWMTVRAQMLRSSGLVLYGGKNTVNYQVASPEKGLPPFDLANSRLGADFTLGAGYRWRLNRPDTGWFFDLSLSARYGRYSYGFRYLSSDEDFFRSFMSCPIRVYENIQKNDNNNGI